MAKRIHFEDDIFYLHACIRIARDALALDLDSEFFLDKTMEDLVFIDTTLARLLKELLENERLIERKEQLLNLAETEERFGALIAALQTGQGSIAAGLAPFSERFAEFRSASLRRRAEIDGATAFGGRGTEDDSALVSPFELNELLKDTE
jgi:hypothetical protein